MKSLKKFVLLSILLFTMSSVLSQDWECEDCPKRKVGLFDLDIWLKNPAEIPSQINYGDWQELFMVAAGVHNVLFNDDPSNECLNYYDGQMAMISNLDEQNYQIGNNATSLPPPAGTMDEVNYWISGVIAQQESDGAVVVKVYVQASGTGDTVIEVTTPYDFTKSGTQNGNDIGQKMIPLMGKIRTFEKKKRNNDDEIVIDPESDPTAKLKLPSKSEIPPLSVPDSRTLAPFSGAPSSESTIVPVTVPCEKAAKLPNNNTNSSSFFIIMCFVRYFCKYRVMLFNIILDMLIKC